ncbi:MAG TPA: hypothetical protein VHC22_32455 [Pirellulales bacterium]|nr:hypothetical protein [Pirellulales bacterium]
MPTTPIIQLPPGQPNYGIITYGEYTFSPFRKIDIQCTPVYDEADRVVTHLQYKMRCFDCVMQNDVQLVHQINMNAMQDALTAPGQQLIIKDIGFDTAWDTFITPDIIWGPKPRMLAMRPYGEICWVFDWEIEFNVSRCVESLSTFFMDDVLMAWNYEVSFTVGEAGFVDARTTSGYIQVMAIHGQNTPANPDGFQEVLFNVDNAWDKLNFALPFGFRRVSNNRTINKAKNRIDFTIVDQEFRAAPFPPGIVNADAKLTYRSQTPGLPLWMGTLSCTYEVAPGFRKSLAVSKFLTLLNDRVTKLQNAVAQGGIAINPAVLPVAMEVEHELYDRTTTISVSFTFTTTADALLNYSGMWQPLPENDWQAWQTSLAKSLSNKGYSGVDFDPAEDRLITICLGGASPSDQPIATLGIPVDDTHDSDGEEDENPDLPADEAASGGYLIFESAAREVRAENFVVHRFAQNYYPGAQGWEDHVTEYQSAPDNYVVMTGRGVRIDQMPDPPQVTSIGGQPVELLKKVFLADDKPTTLCFGHKLYQARWELWYRAKGDPETSSPVGIPILMPSEIEPLEEA